LNDLLNHKKLKAIEWGKTHEKVAIRRFSEKTGHAVEKTGIWLEESGVLGASPDGLIGDEMAIEVKCLYNARHLHPDEAVSDPRNFRKWCIYRENGEWALDVEHDFYHEIQGSLYFTKRKQSLPVSLDT